MLIAGLILSHKPPILKGKVAMDSSGAIDVGRGASNVGNDYIDLVEVLGCEAAGIVLGVMRNCEGNYGR